jgi:hypothetical protein
MEISIPHLRVMLAESAELGATKALIGAGVIKPFLKKAEAYRLYGRTNVDRWLKAQLITPRKDGDSSSSIRIDRQEIEIVAKANNWSAYVPVEDRK